MTDTLPSILVSVMPSGAGWRWALVSLDEHGSHLLMTSTEEYVFPGEAKAAGHAVLAEIPEAEVIDATGEES